MGEEAIEAMDLETMTKKEDGSASVVRWERFLPKMVLRVLVVEADDSTRQIVAALLRKCSYKVAAVSDGLKAWEVLKVKPHNIDLILTEVDLPSISGFALLTLIMEHEICKNIPVIMMSSNDSVSTVYKCMLRGAADFLVKPVRKNELRNLWQHVWRRQSSASGGNGPQDDSVAQQKVEATAENNAATTSNHSSGFRACVKRNRECIEKGSDAQSSCTKPDLEAEREHTEDEELSQRKWSKSAVSDMELQKHKECVKSSRKPSMNDCEDRGLSVAACEGVNTMTLGDENEREHANISSEACYKNHAPVNSSREAIDLIGAFDNYPKCSYRSCFQNNVTKHIDSSPLLDLSLKRSHPNASASDGRHTLHHSEASAFSRYINRASQLPHSSLTMCNQQKDFGSNSDRQLSNQTLNYYSDPHGLSPSYQKNMLSLAATQSGQAEGAFHCPQRTVLPVPVPVRGMRFEFDNLSSAYGSLVPPRHEEPFQGNAFHKSNLEIGNALNSRNENEQTKRQKVESSDDRQYFSSATQSGSSSFCNGTASHLNSLGCGSNGNVNHGPVVRANTESGIDGGVPNHDGNCNRSLQRVAALTKFRMKRKDRCFEKKVRYESRKKLAEQRPRVKGQFVRQAQTETAHIETDSHYRNSLDN